MKTNEFVSFSEMLERELRDPEFRRLYEALDEEDLKIRAKIEAKIKAKKLKEESAKGFGQTQFAS